MGFAGIFEESVYPALQRRFGNQYSSRSRASSNTERSGIIIETDILLFRVVSRVLGMRTFMVHGEQTSGERFPGA
jgi:hypothetical protein